MHRSTAPGQSFSPFFAFSLPPRAEPVGQTVFILRRFALFDAADKSNSCILPPHPRSLTPSLSLSRSSLLRQLLSLPFCCFGAASFSIDFRGFARPTRRLLRSFSIFGLCCTYYLCSLLLLLLLLLLRRFFVRSDP